ncbi:MAG: hypothetical protein HYY76_18150, partial [Acidobacteria bacterium]|nr:hypothetical protein [Acidobacteriota bacterium]
PDVDGASHSVEEGPEPANAAIAGQRNRKPQTIIVGEGAAPLLPYQPWAAARRREHLANVETPTTWAHLEPEDRCLLNGVPRSNYRGNIQILQRPGFVTMLYEWNHAYRIIPLDGRPHAPAAVRLWNGDSRGRWEGRTLVIDVTNFHVDADAGRMQPWFDSHGSFYSDALRVTERWMRVDADTIRYDATIDDPKVFTRSWQIGFNVVRVKESGFELLEEACREGERNTATMIEVGRRAKAAGQTGIHTHDQK